MMIGRFRFGRDFLIADVIVIAIEILIRITSMITSKRAAHSTRGRYRGLVATRFALASLVLLMTGLVPSARSAAVAESDVRRDAAVQAVERVLPSVVNISTETLVEVRDPLDEIFRDFFGPYYRRRPPDAQKSLGSGVIIDEAGYIVTNCHVVQRASRITVTLVDGREFQARELSRTAKSDVALLKIVTRTNEKFQALKFAADDDLLLAETVLALGNPFGLGVSVSRGILSSKTRRPAVEGEPLEREDWLQTDAAINPGHSGGPLVNLRGELIGLNVAIYREGQGIGFAIPVKRVSEALSEIFTPEEIRSLWFGARFRGSTNGLVTAAVEVASPAEKAGLRVGDVILRVNGKSPRTVTELNREIVAAGERREVQLQIQRHSEHRDVSIHLIPEKEVFNASLVLQKTGASVQELTAELAGQMGLENAGGILVQAVEKNSPVARANLTRGCVIQAIDGQALEDVHAAAKVLHARKAGEVVELTVWVPRVRGRYLEIVPARAKISVR